MQFVQEESVATALLLNGVEPGQDDTTFLALHGNHLCVEKSKYPAAAPQKEKKPEVYVVFNSVIFFMCARPVPTSSSFAAFKPRNLRVKQDEVKMSRKPHLAVANMSSSDANENVDTTGEVVEGGGKTNADFRKYLS